MSTETRIVFIVSDGTGITADNFSQSILAQFEASFKRIRIPFVDSVDKAHEAVSNINQAHQKYGVQPIVFTTLVNPELNAIVTKANGLILDMFQTFVAPMKSLQMVKDVSWDYVYQNVYSDVLRNAVALYIVEVLQQTMQPEPHPEMFYLIEDTFKQLDKGGAGLVSNLPIYFLIHLSQTMGFGLQGKYSTDTPILDIKEGEFVAKPPAHPYYLEAQTAQVASTFLEVLA